MKSASDDSGTPNFAPTQPPKQGGRPPFSPLDFLAGLPPHLLLSVAGLVFGCLSFWAMSGETATADEPTHLLAGCLSWRHGDFSFNPEHPPLAKLLMAAPLLLADVRLPGEKDGFVFLYQSGNDPDTLLGLARASNVVWGLLILTAVYYVARSLYGPRGAALSLILATFCPLLLAHSHLVTTDVAVAALGFLTIWAFARTYGRLSVGRCLGCGTLLGLSLSTKFNAVYLIPVVLWSWWIAHVRRVRAGQTADPSRPWDEALRVRTLGKVIGALLLVGAASWTVVWAMYGFKFKASPDPEHEFAWNFPQMEGTLTMRAAWLARDYRLLPESFLYGYLYVQEHATRRRAYALGLYSDTGWFWYFPFAMLVKTPTATLVVMAWGLLSWLRRSRDVRSADDFLVVPTIIYGVLSMASNLNIGVRHMLPVYPMLLTLAGGIPLPDAASAATLGRRVLPILLATSSAVETLTDAPYFLAFFNVPARLAAERHRLLVDSNLDWGQDLGRLKKWLDRHGIGSVKLSYFGSGSPRHLNLRHEILPGACIYRWYEREWKEARDVQPGDIVAVSASNFVGALVEEDRDFFLKRFGHLRPVVVIGRSILVFKVPAP
jgi:hypothetical protein